MALSPVPILSDDAPSKRVKRCQEYFRKARAPKDQLHQNWERWYRALYKTQEKSGRQLQKPLANEIFPTITALVGWLGDARPRMNVGPSGYDPESEFFQRAAQIAQDLEKVLEWIQRQRKFEIHLERFFFDALTYGTSFMKAGWDPALTDGMGDVTARRVDPWLVYPDPLATDLEQCRFFIEVRQMSRDEAVSRYGERAENIKSGKDWASNTRRPTMLDKGQSKTPMAIAGPILAQPTQYGAETRPSFGEVTVYEPVQIAECWFLNDDQWELSVIGGGEELKHFNVRDDLFEFGKPPYLRYVVHETGEFWGPSLVDFLTSPQDALNDLLFHAHNNIRLSGDPMFEEAVQAGTTRTRLVNRPGQRIPVNAPGMLKWLEPPTMPPAMIQLLNFWIAEFERIAGLAGITRGGSPSRRESSDSLQWMGEGSFTRVRNALRNLEHGLLDLGEMLCSIVAEKYTEGRIISIVGPEGEPTVVALKPRHFFLPSEREPEPEPQLDDTGNPVLDETGAPVMTMPEQSEPEPLRFSVWAEAGSANPATRQAQIEEAQTYFSMGVIDREALLAHRRWPGWRKIVERIAEKEAAGAFAPPAARRRSR